LLLSVEQEEEGEEGDDEEQQLHAKSQNFTRHFCQRVPFYTTKSQFRGTG